MTYYELLEVSENASTETITAAYHALAKKYHPDVFVGDKKIAEEKMQELNDAYEVLSSESKRKFYDKMLIRESKTPPKSSCYTTDNNIYSNSDRSDSCYSSDAYKYAKKIAHREKQKKQFHISPYVIRIFLLIALALILYIVFDSNSTKNDQNSHLVAVTEPISGTILYGSEYINESEIKVTAPNDESCVVKLKTSLGVTKIAFYVRAGETVTIGVPREKLYVYFACGETWYGYEYFFGENTVYSKDNKLCDFSNYTWTYKLQPTTNGNVNEKYISKEDFYD